MRWANGETDPTRPMEGSGMVRHGFRDVAKFGHWTPGREEGYA